MDGSILRKLQLPVAGWAVLLALIAVAGCGRSDPKVDAESDIEKVRSVASSVGGAATEPERWKITFVEGAAPAESEKPRYAKYTYFAPREDVNVDGDSATASVRVEDVDENVIGKTEWTFQKDSDGDWKIKTSPLPDGA